MSDIKITLPGTETVTLTGQTIDKLIRVGDGDAALLYLYILKTHGQKTSSEAAIALDKSKGWVASAMAVLSQLGLVHLDDAAVQDGAGGLHDGAGVRDGTGVRDGAAVRDGAGVVQGVARAAQGSESKEQYREPRQYTENEVKNVLMEGSDFSIVVDETQRRLGKILSPDELLRLFGIYENLRLPPEVILQLITHCIKESSVTGDGRAPSVRYIEKAAFTWEREGIFSHEKAEEYLKGLEARKSVRGEIKRILQIRDRELSATEKRFVDGWIEMGFQKEAVAVAYDRAVVKTGGQNLLPYMDGIMKNWHNKGIHTAEEIAEKDGGQKRSAAGTGGGYGVNTPGANAKPGTQKHGEPNREEMERMQRLLNKIKED